MGPHMSGGLLLGRRSYEGMLGAWNAKGEDHPFAQALNAMPKWVVTRSVTDAAWPNTTLLPGDPVEVVRDLKGQAGPELGVMGSGQLLRAIAPHGLVDEWLLMIHPIVLGSGQRLFDHEGALAELELVDSTISGSGVFVGTYRPAHR